MTKIPVRLFIFVLILNFQCKKHDSKPSIDVSKITFTDQFGSILSEDLTDWKTDDQWTNEEQRLFQTPNATALAGTETSVLSVYPAWPNPVASQQSLLVKASKACLLQIVITDNHLEVKKRYTVMVQPPSLAVTYMFDRSIFSNKSNYRVYYGFYSSTDALFAKGHGDIKIDR